MLRRQAAEAEVTAGIKRDLRSPDVIEEICDTRMSTRELQAALDSYLLLGRRVAVKPARIDDQ
jgi:hypothetical protein